MKSKKEIRSDIVDLLSTKALSKNNLLDILAVVKNVNHETVSSDLIIPTHVRYNDNGHFKGRVYYTGLGEKLVWEEED